jgi:hypothetical protein
MALQEISFNHPINNSAQVGDIVYIASTGGGSVTTNEPVKVGKIVEINTNHLLVDSNVPSVVTFTVNNGTAFIFFSKPIEVNKSSLKGYYAEVEFMNSPHPTLGTMGYVELFAISSEVSLSSK